MGMNQLEKYINKANGDPKHLTVHRRVKGDIFIVYNSRCERIILSFLLEVLNFDKASFNFSAIDNCSYLTTEKDGVKEELPGLNEGDLITLRGGLNLNGIDPELAFNDKYLESFDYTPEDNPRKNVIFAEIEGVQPYSKITVAKKSRS